ncbi:pentapeptide repeat-containing protein [Agromyces atrinae]|uniref:Pentapeptide repeat-containing protein n=1 Tax=Agromyces atrinae TaxID=592376 RepID=A0A4Q2M353_9MICO|nr:pentapeptide repeat-containing protein [Agromyces atrinae]NYD66078.1 uncharacterized protein YjbI with pentapeptide repeats [Agromyces atrinae]RXZ86404.1 pentapeptide repeat-containing protein [Agromyces atrinae]
MTNRRTAPPTRSPRLSPVRLEGLTAGDALDIESGAHLDGFELDALTLDSIELASANLSECRLASITAIDVDLAGARISDSVIERWNVPVLAARRSTWRDVEVRDSRIGSAEFYGSEVRSVLFENCKLGFVNLRGATFTDIRFVDCTIDELDLGQATVSRLAFERTSVDQIELAGATLEHTDLRGARLAVVNGVDRLRGTIVTPEQLSLLAPLIAANLGIDVDD